MGSPQPPFIIKLFEFISVCVGVAVPDPPHPPFIYLFDFVLLCLLFPYFFVFPHFFGFPYFFVLPNIEFKKFFNIIIYI